MAAPNDGRVSERKTFLERKKEVFEKMKDADKELRQIRQEEMAENERQQQQNDIEHIRRTLESLKIENAKLRRKLQVQEKKPKSSDDMSAGASASDDKIERLEIELSCMKKKTAVCEREYEGAEDVNEMKEELKTLRHQNVEQSASLRQLKDAMQRITTYSKTQQKEKGQALREVASLRDEISALRQISEETQQRQLNELQSTTTTVKHQQQQRTGKPNELTYL